MKAFRLATVTKRVMLRLEANLGQPARLYWHDINDVNYEMDPNDITKLNKVILVRQDTGLSKIPCRVITNEQSIINPYGLFDIKYLRPLQDQYNRKLSDFSDALRFNMFGQDVFIEATSESVNQSKIAPNSVIALVSLDEKKAEYKKVENTFSNAEPVKMYLNLLENRMYEKLGIPISENLQQVP